MIGIAPGGAYESLFGDQNYPVMWQSRVGFAKVALKANKPIIPVFTENIRENTLSLAGRMTSGRSKIFIQGKKLFANKENKFDLNH